MRLGPEFLSFAVVGAIGFLVDAGVLHIAVKEGLGLYGGRALSFTLAATCTWLLNRRYTFRWQHVPPGLGEWSHYVGLMGLGGLVNFGIYAACVSEVLLVAHWPVVGVAAGSLGGLTVNFLSSRFLLYRAL